MAPILFTFVLSKYRVLTKQRSIACLLGMILVFILLLSMIISNISIAEVANDTRYKPDTKVNPSTGDTIANLRSMQHVNHPGKLNDITVGNINSESSVSRKKIRTVEKLQVTETRAIAASNSSSNQVIAGVPARVVYSQMPLNIGDIHIAETIKVNPYKGIGDATLNTPTPPLPDPYSPGALACGGGDNYGLACETCDAGSRAGLTCLDSGDCPSGTCVPNNALCPGATCGGVIAGGGSTLFTYPKSRFIGFQAPTDGSWDGKEVGVRVILESIGPNASCNGQTRFAGTPEQFCEGGACSTMFWAASLVADPVFMDWTTVGSVQLYGEEVVSDSRYAIQAIDITSASELCIEANYSQPPLIVDTAKWGDVVVPLSGFSAASQPSISDVLKLVDKWLGNLEPRKSRTLLQPGALNVSSSVGIADILKGVDAWLGTAYPFPITSCEGIPPCEIIPPNRTNVEPPKNNEFASANECHECQDSDPTGLMDPVYLFSGEFYETVVDLRIPGRGIDFIWGRKYRSRIGPNTAMGNGWDFSYNLNIEADGQDLILHNGNSRSDTYLLQLDGTWTRREFFRVLEQNLDDSYTLLFPNTSEWNFNPLDGSPQQGKVASIIDRNGNTLTFDYDGFGRLVTIHDTLDTLVHNRDITIAYNAADFIESVTDFAGRSVTYEYYDGIEPGGNFGDLKSVTTPSVVNNTDFPILSGHEYPTGKTTVYTYSTSFIDNRLNHNLLTITDSKGQTYLLNEYDPTTDPNDLNFDRILRQTWGNTGDIIDLVYLEQTPTFANGFAITKVILNDRVGNVKEFFYDEGNRGGNVREFTGRANPDLPTTETLNRPTGKLRIDDPTSFESRYEYNADSLRTNITDANGNEQVPTYDTSNPSRRSQGNASQQCTSAGPLGGDQVEICESYEYDDDFGGCCGTNFVTKHVDGRGNETLHTYDVSGNRTHTQHRIPSIVEDWEYNAFGQMTAHILPDNGNGHRRRDEYTYYDSGPQMGYLHQMIIDAPNLALTTTYEYNKVGQVTRVTDPRGHDTQYIVNQLDQIVRSNSREVTDGGGVRYERDTFYDPNDNVVRVDIQNKDNLGVLQANSHFTTVYEYEILNYQTKMCQEVEDYIGAFSGTQQVPLCTGLEADFLSTEYLYDANRNQILTRYGEAVENRQPTNVTETRYDERDLTFQQIRAPSDPAQSTTQYDYDNNRNTTKVHQGLENTPRISTSAYDGYDRLVTSTDPMGNDTRYNYDSNNNRITTRTDGELIDVPGNVGNARLSEATYVYDAMDRLTKTDFEFFDTDTQTPIDDGKSTSQSFYSDNSQVTRVVNDNAHQRLITYDTVNRRRIVTDHLNNTVTYTYDNNSNITATLELEKSDLGNPDETFTSTYVYDNLDRLIQTVDNVGNTNTYAHDSRNNQTLMDDALNNEIRYTYDGINRMITTIRDLDDDGADGDGLDITTTQSWDDTSRLITLADDKNNTTTHVYDALNRMTSEVYADNTVHAYTFDVHDNRLTTTNANGSVSSSTYDLLDRLIIKTIAPGVGVSSDTTFEIYKYDGLSRLVHAEDNDSIVTRSYNSLFRVTRETLNSQTMTDVYDGVGNPLTCTYPGGREVTNTYDELERKKTISDVGGTIATYDHVGPGRVERREYGNGTRTDYTYDGITGTPNPAGDFGVKRIIRTKHTKIAGGIIIDDRTYAWDQMYNKTQRKDVRIGGPLLTHDYTYDDSYRLVHTTVTNVGAIVVRDTDYDLDGVGNRTTVAGALDLGPHVGTYTMDATLPNPADDQMNQYTTTSADARVYDFNGNLILIDSALSTQRDIVYDYLNQMVEYTVNATNQRHTYAYDALGRRIERVVDADGVASGPTETRYFYHGWQVIEQHSGASTTLSTYIYGLYIDEVLNMRRSTGLSHCDNAPVVPCTIDNDCPLGGICLADPPTDYYYHGDDHYNVMAMTDAAGTVVERYEYADYGQPIDPTTLAPIVGDPSPIIGNPYLFTGRRYDPETAWYYYRTRYLNSVAGRFTTRDIIGIWGDFLNFGNSYSYVGNNPSSLLDPSGLEPLTWSTHLMDYNWENEDMGEAVVQIDALKIGECKITPLNIKGLDQLNWPLKAAFEIITAPIPCDNCCCKGKRNTGTGFRIDATIHIGVPDTEFGSGGKIGITGGAEQKTGAKATGKVGDVGLEGSSSRSTSGSITVEYWWSRKVVVKGKHFDISTQIKCCPTHCGNRYTCRETFYKGLSAEKDVPRGGSTDLKMKDDRHGF